MTRAIWKYPLNYDDRQTLRLPRGAKILSFGMQGRHPMIWVLVDPHEEELEARYFRFAGTGHGLSDEVDEGGALGAGRFIGTTFEPPLVWHLFEVGIV